MQMCVQYGIRTPEEVGVDLKKGYNGHLTSREAGSVGGQMVKNLTPERTKFYVRNMRSVKGYSVKIQYITSIFVI